MFAMSPDRLLTESNVNIACSRVQISQDIGMTDAQYGMLTGYAYFLLLSVAMVFQGYIIDRYALNRLYVVGFGGLLGAAALFLQVCVSALTPCSQTVQQLLHAGRGSRSLAQDYYGDKRRRTVEGFLRNILVPAT